MGTTCTVPRKTNIAIPSRVMMIGGSNALLVKKCHSDTTSGGSFSSHKLSSRPDSQSLSVSKEKSLTNEPQTAVELDEDPKMTYQLTHSLAPHYDLQELGIGEYYLEDEISNPGSIKSLTIKKVQSLKTNEWDTVIVLMRNNRALQTSLFTSLSTDIDACLKEFSIQKPKIYTKMLKKGPPMRYRWSVWKNILEPDRFYVYGLYEKLKGLSSQWENDIRKDIHRTFPSQTYFASSRHENVGQDQLFNTLKVVSLYFPNIGYLQGMNFLMGFLLMLSGGNELDAFWAFVSLTRDPRYFMIGFFEPGFPLLDFYLYMFHKVLAEELPDVHEHLKQQMIPDQLYVFKWFLTVFLFSVPQVHEVKIWDFVLTSGLFGIVRIAVAILKIYEKDILELDSVGMDQFFRHLKGEEGRAKNGHRTDASNLNLNQSVLQNQNVSISMQRASVMRNNLDMENLENGYQEVSCFQYTFEDFEIEEVLKIAEKIPLSLEKIMEMAETYTAETTKKLPRLYSKYLGSLGDIYEKEAEIQEEVNYCIMKSQLAEKVNEEIVVSNLLNDIDAIDILNHL